MFHCFTDIKKPTVETAGFTIACYMKIFTNLS
jgi:hypothetical protein